METTCRMRVRGVKSGECLGSQCDKVNWVAGKTTH